METVHPNNNTNLLQDVTAGVMNTDHPLLEKFHVALEQHLQRVKAELESEILELDHEVKELVREREDVGSMLYDLQQEVDRQNSILDEYSDSIHKVLDKRMEYESNAREIKMDCNSLSKDFNNANRIHQQHTIELSNLNLLLININKWKTDIKNDLEGSKRMVNKDSQDKIMKAEQKKKMDFFLLKLETQIRERNEELQSFQNQLANQKSNIEVINNSLADANTDLDALRHEHKHLYSSWNEVIIAIQNRDKVLSKIKTAAEEEKSKQKTIRTNLEGTKKQAAKEMDMNEKLETQRIMLSEDVSNLNRQLEKSKSEMNSLVTQIKHWDSMVIMTEDSLNKAQSEQHLSESKLNSLQREFERWNNKNVQMENSVLQLLQEQITTGNGSKRRTQDLRNAQDKRRELESAMFVTEQNLAEVMFELERLKGSVLRDKQHATQLADEQHSAELEADRYEMELNTLKKSIEVKLKSCDALNKELAQLIDAAGGFELDPLEVKIGDIEKDIKEIELRMKATRNDWLRYQQETCQLSAERSRIMNNTHICEKQFVIIVQKTLHIECELNDVIQDDAKITRETNNLMTKLELVSSRLFEKKKINEIDKVQNETAYNEIVDRLRIAETTIVQMKTEIQNSEKDIEVTKLTVIDMHRESLSWERKWKMVVESKQKFDEEYAKTSEIGLMKTEIRRMEVRYGQLKRAQEKLVQDMEQSVQHRDHIYGTASVKSKMKHYKPQMKDRAQQRLNEIKVKIRRTEKNIKIVQHEMIEVLNEKDQTEEQLKRLNQAVEAERMQYTLLQNEIEQSMLLKQDNLENIIRVQHRTKRYRSLTNFSQLPKCRGESIVDRDYDKHKEINLHLICVLQELLSEFPDNKVRICKVIQTLKS